MGLIGTLQPKPTSIAERKVSMGFIARVRKRKRWAKLIGKALHGAAQLCERGAKVAGIFVKSAT